MFFIYSKNLNLKFTINFDYEGLNMTVRDQPNNVYYNILLFERYITYILLKSMPIGILQIFMLHSTHVTFIWEELRFKKLTTALRTIYGSFKYNLKRVYNKYE